MKEQQLSGLVVLAAMASLPLVVACGTTSPTGETSPAVSAPAPAALSCASAGPASQSWQSPDQRTGTTPPIVSARVAGDTLTLTFDQGTPAFEVTTQPSAHFIATDGRGGPVDLSGSAGVLIVLRGFRGDMQNYTGAKDFPANGQMLVEVREIGDFEGVIGWAAGLSRPGCAHVEAGTSTLTFPFVGS
jgi:hypothetical protein